MKLVILSVSLLSAVCLADRQKIRDFAGELLVPLSDLPTDACSGDNYFGLAIINGSLEKCVHYNEIGKNETNDSTYEEYKCRSLRYPNHASIKNGKCECNYIYRGPTCASVLGCPDGQVRNRNGTCEWLCENGGTAAIGPKKLECICPIPYDGDRCERVACFRKSPVGKQRYRNSNTKPGTCECKANFHGDNCEIIRHCEQNATLTNQICDCPDGFGGEVCELKCRQGQLTCSTCSTTFLLSMLVVFTAFFWRQA